MRAAPVGKHNPGIKSCVVIANWRCPTQGVDVCVEDFPGSLPPSVRSLIILNEAELEVGAVLGVGKQWERFDVALSFWQVRKGGRFFRLYRGLAGNFSIHFTWGD